jgi:hypothetical protein
LLAQTASTAGTARTNTQNNTINVSVDGSDQQSGRDLGQEIGGGIADHQASFWSNAAAEVGSGF